MILFFSGLPSKSEYTLHIICLIFYRLILGNYLASQFSKPDKPISAAMVISVPWNVFKGTESIEKPILNLLMNRHLAGGLCRNIERYTSHHVTEL